MKWKNHGTQAFRTRSDARRQARAIRELRDKNRPNLRWRMTTPQKHWSAGNYWVSTLQYRYLEV